MWQSTLFPFCQYYRRRQRVEVSAPFLFFSCRDRPIGYCSSNMITVCDS